MDSGFNFLFKAIIDQNSLSDASKTFQSYVSSHKNDFSIALNIDTNSLGRVKSYLNEISKEFQSTKFNNPYSEISGNILKNIDSQYQEHIQTVKRLESEYVNLKTKMYDVSKSGGTEIDLGNYKDQLSKLSSQIKETFSSGELKEFEKNLGSIDELINSGSEQVVSVKYFGDSIAEANSRLIELKGTGQTVVDVMQSFDTETGNWVNTSVKTTDSVKQLESQTKNLSDDISVLLEKMGGLSNSNTEKLVSLQNELSGIDVHSNDAADSINNISKQIEVLKGSLAGSSGALTQYKRVLNSLVTDETASFKAETYGANQDYIILLKEKIELEKEELANIEKGIVATSDITEKKNAYKEAQRRLEVQIKAVAEQHKKETNWLYNVQTGLKQAAARVVDYTLAYRALWQVVKLIKDAMKTAIDLNSSFTDIQMVTLGTDESIKQLSEDYAKLAEQMSSTVIEVAKGADEWLRQGKSAEDTSTLLKSSMVLAKVGAIDSADATTYLTAALNGYKISAEGAMHVVDALSQADVESASSVSDLAVALERSANTANMAGVPLEKLIGYIAEVKEVTQKSAATVGESMKTIFSRMGSVKAGTFLDEDLESEYTNISSFINDVEKVLSKVGIRVRDTNQDFRDAGDILDDIAAKWSTYTDLEKNAISTAVAGTRQRESFIALNF